MTSIIEERDNAIMTTDDELESYGPLIEGIATDCAANRKEIANVNKRLDKTERELSNLSFEVGGQRQQLAAMSIDIADIKDAGKATNLRLLKIEAEASETNKRLARLEAGTEQRFSQVDARLDDMKATQVVQGDKLAEILAAVQRLGVHPDGKCAQN